MRHLAWPLLAVMTLAGCAQTPSAQISSPETVRVCQGNQCVDQHRSTVTLQANETDPESERRLATLTELAQQSPQAAYDLGLRLLRGDGIERNSFLALEWMRKAAEQGLATAQFAVGQLYLNGFEEMGADPAEAQAWLTRAASQGHQEAIDLLPQAQAAQKNTHHNYQHREALRQAWGRWYNAAPYYWHWKDSGWYVP